jgi:hypothetical protein
MERDGERWREMERDGERWREMERDAQRWREALYRGGERWLVVASDYRTHLNKEQHAHKYTATWLL